jgi:hypothetical protein
MLDVFGSNPRKLSLPILCIGVALVISSDAPTENVFQPATCTSRDWFEFYGQQSRRVSTSWLGIRFLDLDRANANRTSVIIFSELDERCDDLPVYYALEQKGSWSPLNP